MNRADINYWLSPKFDPAPPTDEELNAGHPIRKSMLARLLAADINTMVERGWAPDIIAQKVGQLARMVKDEEWSDQDALDEEIDSDSSQVVTEDIVLEMLASLRECLIVVQHHGIGCDAEEIGLRASALISKVTLKPQSADDQTHE